MNTFEVSGEFSALYPVMSYSIPANDKVIGVEPERS
jgi:hypothetical protein